MKPLLCTAELLFCCLTLLLSALLPYSDLPDGGFLFPSALSRSIIILVKAGAPVDATIKVLEEHLEPGDCIIDGGNEW